MFNITMLLVILVFLNGEKPKIFGGHDNQSGRRQLLSYAPRIVLA